MKKVITPRVHGILDYFGAASFALAPKLFSLSGLPAQLLYVLAGIGLVLAVTSQAPAGLIKVVPMRVHAMAEVVTAPVVIALPWLLGFAENPVARYVFIAAGGGLILFWLLTDYEGTSHPASPSVAAQAR